MMKITHSNAKNMQGATGIDPFVTAPPTASTRFTAQVAHAPIESSISGNKAGDRALASLWIQRLKPRDEPETFKGETFTSDIETRHGLHIEKSEPGSSAHLFGGLLQKTSSIKACDNEALSKKKMVDKEQAVKKDALNKIRQQSSSSEQQGGRQQNMCEQRRGRVTPSPIPSNSGFGKQISQNAGANLERKSATKPMTVDMNVNSRYTLEPAMILQTCSQAVESKSQGSDAGGQAERNILASSLGKPPLPPVHSKSGCPPRPTGHKSLGFSAWSTGRITSSPANDKLAAMPVQDIIRYPSHNVVRQETLSASDTSARPLLKKGCQAKENGLDCQNPLLKEDKVCTADRQICPRTQVRSGSQTVVPAIEPVTRQLPVSYSEGVSSSLMYKSRKRLARQDLEAMDVIALGTGISKNLEALKVSRKIGGVKGPSGGESGTGVDQPPSNVLKDSSMRKPPSECSAGSGQAEETVEATPSASSTASFPWEMFVEAAGPSRSARQEFVEVYNRARDELKNQKASSKVSDKKMETRPGFASRRATRFQNTSIVMHEGQTSERQLQPEISEKLKKVNGSVSQANFKVINAHASLKEQLSKGHHCVSFLEGVDVNSKPKEQAFQSVHVTCGKNSTSFVYGEPGGPLHGYVESPAVAPKDCSSTLEKSSQCKQGFASSAAPKLCYQAASTCRELFQPRLVDKAERDIKGIQSKSLMLPRKRQRGIFDSSPSATIRGKESAQCERLPSRSEYWLQRWYPPHNSIKNLHEHKLSEADRLKQDLALCSASNVLKESEKHGACDKATDSKKRLIEEGSLFQRIVAEAEPKHLKISSEKVLPSAAAMAIVGTAARQFCMAQPQRKGSFAFWSGFGMPATRTPEHSIEKGKRKLPFEADSPAQP